ncbi:MAG: DNA-binding protein [Gammaproteobacteria bacterium]|nr:DNA-binding protein [Gammaproteobacteria bacterium]
MNQEVKDRIFAAADRLLSESPTNEFPTVDQVRQASSAGMNYVVEALKEWRQKQRTVARSVIEPLPESLHLAVFELGQNVWKIAQGKAHETLEVARAAFEAEKADLTKLSTEQSNAFELLSQEMDQTQIEAERLAQELLDTKQTIQTQAQQLVQLQERLGLAEARTQEIEKWADGLQAKLEQVHTEARAEQHKAVGEISRLNVLLEIANQEAIAVKVVLQQAQEQAAVQKAEKESYISVTEAERERERVSAREAEQRLSIELVNVRGEAAKSSSEAAQCQGELKGLRQQAQEQMALIKAMSVNTGADSKD